MIKQFKNLPDIDLDLTVFRYLTFPKFISMLSYQALWFPKLNILRDKFEGGLPFHAEIKMREQNEQWKKTFNSPEFHAQINSWPETNVRDGRELTVVNCWFLGSNESQKMWDEYVSNPEGVIIKSTVRKLMQHVYTDPGHSQIGRVKYVKFSEHTMSTYEASQAWERALLKDNKYRHEQEIRIMTFNFKHQGCVSMEGRPYTPEQCSGKNMNNFENPGLYVGINFVQLIDKVVLAQNAPAWFEHLIRRIFELSKFSIPIERSKIITTKKPGWLENLSKTMFRKDMCHPKKR